MSNIASVPFACSAAMPTPTMAPPAMSPDENSTPGPESPVFAVLREPPTALDDPAHDAAHEDRRGGRDGEVHADARPRAREARDLDHDGDERADEDQAPRQLLREDAVDDERHDLGLWRVELVDVAPRSRVARGRRCPDRRSTRSRRLRPRGSGRRGHRRFARTRWPTRYDLPSTVIGSRSNRDAHARDTRGDDRRLRVVQEGDHAADDERRGGHAEQQARSAGAAASRRRGSRS